jgi:hypothetical protein
LTEVKDVRALHRRQWLQTTANVTLEAAMLGFTETVLNVTIWSLCAAGLFFGLRAARRKRREAKESVK